MEPKPTIGITFSTFDLLHAGHIRMLADAKTQCDYLIVGLQTDPTIDRPEKNRPTQTLVERYTQLKGCRFVDEIIPYTTEQDLDDILRLYAVNVRIIGEEYREKEFTGRKYCEENKISLVYNSRSHRFSSTGLRREVYESECAKQMKKV